MGVYIDREEAIKCLDGNVLITRQSEAEAVREYFEMVIKRLENLPTIDLVRCGECKHRDPEDKKCDSGMLERQGCIFPVADDYFCKYGERRSDEHTIQGT